MFSQDPGSFDDERGSCVKCSVVSALEARLSELEARIRTLEGQPSYSQIAAGTAVRASPSVAVVSPPASPAQPGQDQDRFVTQRKRKSKTRASVVQENRASGDQGHRAQSRATEDQTQRRPAGPVPPARPQQTRDCLVIGSSIVRGVRLRSASTICLPGARLGDIEGSLRLLRKNQHRYRRVIIHGGGNDLRRRQSEVTKLQVEAVCDLARSMSQDVVFSGPLPNYTTDEMFSRFSSFNDWLKKWCPEKGVVYIDNWQAFEGKPRLLRRDGIHLTPAGTSLLAQNLSASLE